MAWSSSDRAARLPSNWAKLRQSILKRDGYLCQIAGPGCTMLATEVDHITHGDDHDPSNLQALCHRCHAAKTASEAKGAQSAIRSRSKREPEAHPGWG